MRRVLSIPVYSWRAADLTLQHIKGKRCMTVASQHPSTATGKLHCLPEPRILLTWRELWAPPISLWMGPCLAALPPSRPPPPIKPPLPPSIPPPLPCCPAEPPCCGPIGMIVCCIPPILSWYKACMHVLMTFSTLCYGMFEDLGQLWIASWPCSVISKECWSECFTLKDVDSLMSSLQTMADWGGLFYA